MTAVSLTYLAVSFPILSRPAQLVSLTDYAVSTSTYEGCVRDQPRRVLQGLTRTAVSQTSCAVSTHSTVSLTSRAVSRAECVPDLSMPAPVVEAEHVFGTFPSGEPDYRCYEEKNPNDVTAVLLPVLLEKKCIPAEIVNEPFFPDHLICTLIGLDRKVRVDYDTIFRRDACDSLCEVRTPVRTVFLDPLPVEDDRLNNTTHVVPSHQAPFESWKTLDQLRQEGPVLTRFNGKRRTRHRLNN